MHPLDWRQFFALQTQEMHSWFEKFTYPWEFLEHLQELFFLLPKGEILGKISPLAHIENPQSVFIAQTAVVEPFAFIAGPCYIGEHSVVRHSAYVRGDVFVGKQCVIGHSTEVKSALFFDEAHAGHFNYVGNTILGNRVNLGAGTKCANLRLDRKAVNVHGEGCRMNTGMKKLGAIIGDEVQIGCNAVLNPGTLIAKHSLVAPCVSTGGFISPKKLNT